MAATTPIKAIDNMLASVVALTSPTMLPLRLLGSQTRQVTEGGPRVLMRKAYTLSVIPVSVLIVIAVRLLRPVVLIRFGKLASDRIGHFAANTELYLLERTAGIGAKSAFDVFYHQQPICNLQLKRMWERTLHVSPWARPIHVANRINRSLPGGESHVIPKLPEMDVHGLRARSQPCIALTAEEERAGWAAVHDLGLTEATPFVCIFTRDSEYLESVDIRPDRGDWRYQDYRDSSIYHCLPAAEEMTRRGLRVVRMGAKVRDHLDISNPMIIDYASQARTEFLDVFLSAKCRFFLGSTAGLSTVPKLFRRPLAYINFVPLDAWHLLTLAPESLFIPKKLWLHREERLMTVRESLEYGVGGFLSTDQYHRLGVELLENTPDEIEAVATEMDDRLRGIWNVSEEDEELQRRFGALFEKGKSEYAYPSRIGTLFLRQNRELLD